MATPLHLDSATSIASIKICNPALNHCYCTSSLQMREARTPRSPHKTGLQVGRSIAGFRCNPLSISHVERYILRTRIVVAGGACRVSLNACHVYQSLRGHLQNSPCCKTCATHHWRLPERWPQTPRMLRTPRCRQGCAVQWRSSRNHTQKDLGPTVSSQVSSCAFFCREATRKRRALQVRAGDSSQPLIVRGFSASERMSFFTRPALRPAQHQALRLRRRSDSAPHGQAYRAMRRGPCLPSMYPANNPVHLRRSRVSPSLIACRIRRMPLGWKEGMIPQNQASSSKLGFRRQSYELHS